MVLEGESFSPGDNVAVYGIVKGEERKLAVVRIRKSKGTHSIGKVISGTKNCKRIIGARARSQVDKGSVPALDFVYMGGMLLLATKGMHQDASKAIAPLNLVAYFDAAADVYPFAFGGGKGFLSGLGIGGAYRMSRIQPELIVTGPDGVTEAGKQQVLPQFLKADAILRFAYSDGKLVTELRGGFLSHKLEQKITTQGIIVVLPLRQSQYTGYSVGAKQRFNFGSFRLSGGVTVGLGLSGLSNNMVVRQPRGATVAVKSPSALGFDGGIDYRFGKFKITAGASYLSFSSNLELIDKTPAQIGESYTFFGVGIGLVL